MKVVAIANQKGGVGKTTLAFHLAWGLFEKGARVLVVDFDPQGNLSLSFGHRRSCTAGALFSDEKVEANLQTVPASAEIPADKFSIVTSDRELALWDGDRAKFGRLRRGLRQVAEKWDWVVIDCPPSLGTLTLNSLAAADYVLVPSEPTLYSVMGMRHLRNTIEEAQEELSARAQIVGIVINAISRTLVASDVIATLEKTYPGKVFRSMVPRSVRVEEALQHQLPVWRYEAENSAGLALKAVIQEFLTRIEKGEEVKNHGEAA